MAIYIDAYMHALEATASYAFSFCPVENCGYTLDVALLEKQYQFLFMSTTF